jgi:hypothetical protein
MATKKSSAPTKKASSGGSKSSPAKSSPAKSSPAKSSTAKSTDTSSSTKKSPTRKRRADAPRAEAPKRKSGPAIAAEASRQLLELTGRGAEGVTGLERTDDGWKVHVEVVEVRRIPDTTDVLALYEVDVDTDGELNGYRRLRRYSRGVPGED